MKKNYDLKLCEDNGNKKKYKLNTSGAKYTLLTHKIRNSVTFPVKK